MAELIATLVEVVVAVIGMIVEALPAILAGLVFVATGAITIIAYAISPQFREKKRQQWKSRPIRKYLDLGIGSLCLAVLVMSGVWILLPGPKRAPTSHSFDPEDLRKGTEFQLTIKARPGTGATNQMKIAVKNGGIAKVLHTKSLHELGQAIRENVTILGSADSVTNKLQSAGPENGIQPFRMDTNQAPLEAGSRQ